MTMGSYDGADVCELVGIYILSALGQRIDEKDTGLYRDDGFIILRNSDGPTTDRIRKDIIRIFKQIGFKIEIKTNLKEADFLDVTFDLRKETYRPYKKENDKLFYINKSSNHPRSTIKQIPTSVSHILSDKMKKFSTMPKQNMKTRSKLLDTQQILNLTPTGQKSEIEQGT